MSRPEAQYQRQDLAQIRTWLGDPEAGIAPAAALSTAIATVTTGWRGFYSELELLPVENPVPASAPVPPATVGVAVNPAAAGAWRMGYGTDLSERRSLTAGLLDALPAILYLTIAVQPWVRMDTAYLLAEKIRDAIAALARAAGWPPNPSVPVAQGADIGTWSTWPTIIRFWSTSPS